MGNFAMKKVLFIAPSFFGYWRKIKDELESRGLEVFYINQSLTTQGIIKRYIDRYGNDILRSKMNFNYYAKKLKKIPDDIDFVFVIKGDSLNKSILRVMKTKYNNASFVMYQWDSTENSPNMVEIANFFDKIYTFDRNDAKKYDWEYRPLFYDKNDCHSTKKDFDISFICTLKFKRGEIYKKLKRIAYKNRLRFYSYLYVDFRTYLKRRIFNKDANYVSISLKEIRFKSMTLEDTAKVYDRSKIVVDYTTSSQSGLSMRTIECVGHGCKLVTNNTNVKSEKFYCSDNVYIYGDDNIEIPFTFFNSPYKKLDDGILDYYSLCGWVDTIFGGEFMQ